MPVKAPAIAHLAVALLLAALMSLSACSGDGKQRAAFEACPCSGTAVCCTSGVCAADQSSCPAATAALSSTVRGVWTGYIENFPWSDDDSIAIAIDVAADGTVSGHARIGRTAAPPPATDASLPWPTGLGAQDPPPGYIPGFTYSAQNVAWDALRLKFMIPKYEPWQPWCGLQTSYPIDGGGYACRADGGASLTLCDTVGACACTSTGCACGGLGVCECDASGCWAGSTWMSAPIGYWFDVAFDGGRGDGSVNLSAGGNDLHNVRLTQTSGQVVP